MDVRETRISRNPSVLRRRSKAKSRSHFDQTRDGIGFHLLHHLAPVCLYRDLADAKFSTDLLIWQTLDHQCQHLAFAQSEGHIAVPEHPNLCFAAEC